MKSVGVVATRLVEAEGKGLELSQHGTANSKDQHAHGIPLCPSCLEHKVKTPVERYKGLALEYCTYHYWLIRGRVNPGGYALNDYIEASKSHDFFVSLPPKESMRIMDESNRTETT